jgi:N-methylhydantoinase B/oxoprolinase/acetone carboxylase alpha subunit
LAGRPSTHHVDRGQGRVALPGRVVPAFGMAGGLPGAPGIYRVVRADGRIEPLAHIGSAEMAAGMCLRSRRRAAADMSHPPEAPAPCR